MTEAYSRISAPVAVIFHYHGSIFKHYCYSRNFARRYVKGNRRETIVKMGKRRRSENESGSESGSGRRLKDEIKMMDGEGGQRSGFRIDFL